MKQENSSEMDVLVLAPFGKDAVLIENVLRQSNLRVRIAPSFKEIVDAVPETAGAAIVAEEALPPAITELAQSCSNSRRGRIFRFWFSLEADSALRRPRLRSGRGRHWATWLCWSVRCGQPR